MAQRVRRLLTIAAGAALTGAAALYFVSRLQGQWQAVGEAFANARYIYLVPSVGFIALMYALRVLRWRVFLNPVRRVPYRAIASATLIGFMSSCVLPLRPGEIIRPFVLHREGGIEFGHAAGTALGLERVFDLIGVCFLLLLTWLLMTVQAGVWEASGEAGGASLSVQHLWRYGVWLMAMTGFGLGCLLALALFPRFVVRAAALVLGLLPTAWQRPLMGFVRSIAESMAFLKSPEQVALGLALSFCIWLSLALSTYTLALGFGAGLPPVGALFVQLVLTGAVAMPQLPSFLGVFQVAAMEGARLFYMPEAEAGAFAVMLWAVNVVPITAVGLGTLWYEGLSLRGLARASRQAAERAEKASGPGPTPC